MSFSVSPRWGDTTGGAEFEGKIRRSPDSDSGGHSTYSSLLDLIIGGGHTSQCLSHISRLITTIATVLILTSEVPQSTDRQEKVISTYVWPFQCTPISEPQVFLFVKKGKKKSYGDTHLIDFSS